MKIVIFRHGETDWNREGRLQGHTDVPLNENGKQQALELSQRLASFEFDQIISSDLSRAFDTATAVARLQQCPVKMDQRLREISLGEYEGMTRVQLQEQFQTDRYLDVIFSKNNDRDVIKSNVEAVLSELKSNENQCVAISTHGGVLWNWIKHYASEIEIGHIKNTDAFLLEWKSEIRYLERISNKKN